MADQRLQQTPPADPAATLLASWGTSNRVTAYLVEHLPRCTLLKWVSLQAAMCLRRRPTCGATCRWTFIMF